MQLDTKSGPASKIEKTSGVISVPVNGSVNRRVVKTNSQTPHSTLTSGALFKRSQNAKFLGVSERTISNMVRGRRIPVIKFGRNVCFDPIRVRKALDK